ncbi:MAG: hypothetical protein AB7F25_12895 [Deferribacterales bacterium]
MRIILFAGPSQVGWTFNFMSELKISFEKLGAECLLLRCEDISFSNLQAIFDRFKPDFSLSINHMFPKFLDKAKKEFFFYDVLQVPHFVYLVDNPYIWLASGTINFDSKFLHVITIDNKHILEQAGVSSVAEIPYGCPASLKCPALQSPDVKNMRVFFAGSISSAKAEAEKVNNSNLLPEQKQAVIAYCQEIFGELSDEKRFLKTNLLDRFYKKYEAEFYGYVKNNRALAGALGVVEKFYECLAREFFVNQLKESGIPCLMAGDSAMAQLCAGAANMKYLEPVEYARFASMLSQMAVNLNVTPKHLHVHDRVTSSLMSGSLLITTPMPKLIERMPELKDVIIQAEFGSVEHLKEMETVIGNKAEYQRRIDAGVEIAEKEMTWDTCAERILAFAEDK